MREEGLAEREQFVSVPFGYGFRGGPALGELKMRDDDLLDQIRQDLDEILTNGAYALTWPAGSPTIELTILGPASRYQRTQCHDVLSSYGVAFSIQG